MNNPRIIGIGTANPALRLTQEQSFDALGYESERIRKMFLNSGIDYRHFHLEADLNRSESSDQLNQRYLRGALKTACRAIVNCLATAGRTVRDVDFLAVSTCTGYVCPDLGSRLIAHMGFRDNVQRASIAGLGCAGAVPTLQRAADFVRAHPRGLALMLAVEICSACYFVDNTLETVVGNAICADGAAAFLLAADQPVVVHYPEVVDFETFLAPEQIEKVGLLHQDGKLRIVLGASIHKLAVREFCHGFSTSRFLGEDVSTATVGVLLPRCRPIEDKFRWNKTWPAAVYDGVTRPDRRREPKLDHPENGLRRLYRSDVADYLLGAEEIANGK